MVGVPLPQRITGTVGVVNRYHWSYPVRDLHIPAWLEVLEPLSDETRPILEASEHAADMDITKHLLEAPCVFCIIDQEGHIWRHPTGLDARNIGPDNVTRWMVICKVDRPKSRACTYVENVCRISTQRCQVKLVFQQTQE